MSEIGRSTIRAVTWRLMPVLGLVYMVAFIDRQNVAYAKLQMAASLGLSERAYGLGAALFFIGYFLCEIPSNLILEKVGARLWFARIIGTWGAVTILLGFTRNAAMFYVLRFLLGAAEAGFFPGVLYLLTLWLPQEQRARAVGKFMLASALANAIGGAIAGFLLDRDGALGLRGWQWVFIATGLPAMMLVPVVLLSLSPHPAAAKWLSDAQKVWLAETLDAERQATRAAGPTGVTRALRDTRVLMLCAVYVGFPLAAYGLSYWLPTIVKGFGLSNTGNGLLNIIPWTLVGLALWLVPRHAARFSGQVFHIVAPAFAGALLLFLSVVVPGAAVKFALLSFAAAAIFAGQPVFWTLPSRFLSGPAAAVGFAAINSVGNLGGFLAQAIVPLIHDVTGSNLVPMLFVAAALALEGLGVLMVEPRLARADNGARR